MAAKELLEYIMEQLSGLEEIRSIPMIANMGKGKHISMETLTKICETLNCDISDVIELERE